MKKILVIALIAANMQAWSSNTPKPDTAYTPARAPGYSEKIEAKQQRQSRTASTQAAGPAQSRRMRSESTGVRTGSVIDFASFSRNYSDPKDAFDALLDTDKMVIVDFYGQNCGPCKRLAPIFEEVAKEYPDIIFVKLESSRYNVGQSIRGVPTVYFYKNGRKVHQFSGSKTKAQLKAEINTASGR